MTRSFYRIDVSKANDDGFPWGPAVEVHRNTSSVYLHCADPTMPTLELEGGVYVACTWPEFWDTSVESVRLATQVTRAYRLVKDGEVQLYIRASELLDTDEVFVTRAGISARIAWGDRLPGDELAAAPPHQWLGR